MHVQEEEAARGARGSSAGESRHDSEVEDAEQGSGQPASDSGGHNASSVEQADWDRVKVCVCDRTEGSLQIESEIYCGWTRKEAAE